MLQYCNFENSFYCYMNLSQDCCSCSFHGGRICLDFCTNYCLKQYNWVECMLIDHRWCCSRERLLKRYPCECYHSRLHPDLVGRRQRDISNNCWANDLYESALFFALSFNAFLLVSAMAREENLSYCVYLVTKHRFYSCFPVNLPACVQMLGLRTFVISR
jgi:hypothetical protein